MMPPPATMTGRLAARSSAAASMSIHIASLVDKRKRGWHDLMAGTCVVKATSPGGNGYGPATASARWPSSSRSRSRPPTRPT